MTEAMYERLKAIVGAERVATEQAALEKYSKDQSFVPSCLPDCVVYAKTVQEVEEVLKAANETNRQRLLVTTRRAFSKSALESYTADREVFLYNLRFRRIYGGKDYSPETLFLSINGHG